MTTLQDPENQFIKALREGIRKQYLESHGKAIKAGFRLARERKAQNDNLHNS